MQQSMEVPDENRNNNLFLERLYRLLLPGPAFNLHSEASMDRARVEHYISEKFHASYQARISDFMPQLLTMSCHGQYCATAGIRSAAGHALFLEQYLPNTIENTLSICAGKSVPRSGIAEIGNLVATQRGSSQLLFLFLAAMLERAGTEWLVFTATPQVQKMIHRLGVYLHTLCDADPSRLVNSNLANWGSYYETHPKVLAGNLQDAVSTLKKRKLYSGILSLYQNRVNELSSIIDHRFYSYEQSAFAA